MQVFEVEAGLDVLHRLVLEADPRLLDEFGKANQQVIHRKAEGVLRRLRHLRGEIEGRLAADRYGLFELNRKGVFLKKMSDHSVEPAQRAIVFIHGMRSGLRIYRPLMMYLTALESARGIRMIGFSYPSDASLARIGIFLKHELLRVCRSAATIDFVCHSAGGLVFRHYAEIGHGEFRRAVFQGTPHGGSDLAQLRQILEVGQLLGNLKIGYSKRLEQWITDGEGQMTFDLQPDSIFLRYLNRGKPPAQRYYIIRGRALRRRNALMLDAGVIAGRILLLRELKESGRSDLVRRSAAEWVERLRLPAEVTNGDLAVSLGSATLSGVSRVETFQANHLELLLDLKVMSVVASILLDDE